MTKPKRKRYLVNRRYQLGLALLLLSILFVVVIVAVFLTHYSLLSIIVDNSIRSGTPHTAVQLINMAMRPLIVVVIIILIIFVLVALYLIYVTHRTAGPLYQLKQAMDKVGKGDFSTKIQIRREDEIHDVAMSFNRMVEDLKKKFGQKE